MSEEALPGEIERGRARARGGGMRERRAAIPCIHHRVFDIGAVSKNRERESQAFSYE